MSWLDLLLVYVAGLIGIVMLVRIALKNEPTAHGQIVGRQVGCIVAVLWPIAVPLLIGVIARQWLKRGDRPW